MNKLFCSQSQYCENDRIEVSYNGCENLADSQRYCSGPFSGRTKKNALVIGEY